jgi:hypothetical protein
MGCGEAKGVSVEGMLVKALWCIGGCEHAEFGLEYMGVDGKVGTTGKTVICCCMAMCGCG